MRQRVTLFLAASGAFVVALAVLLVVTVLGWLNPPDASEAELKKRTLTNLYNARPTWLANARAVWLAYGWPEPPKETDDEPILARLLALNLERTAFRTGSIDGTLQNDVVALEKR